jgi:hypothetical protein
MDGSYYPYLKVKKQVWAGRVDEAEELLPSKHEALSSNPSTTNNKNNNNKRNRFGLGINLSKIRRPINLFFFLI